jgi:hypothetical protein
MNLYQKNALGRKYIRLVTGSPFIYLSFLACMLALFLFLNISTKVDLIKTYQAKLVNVNETPVLAVDSTDFPVGKAFLYTNKNKNVYPVHIQKAEPYQDGTLLHLDGNQGEDILQSVDSQNLYLDVPQGEATLLYFILVKGGKGGG